MKLLIADDHAPMRALLRTLCAPLAAETRDCADGLEALQAFAEFQPDWTILDVAMPGLDGLTVTRRILAAHPAAQIAVITHHPGPEFERAAREAGARSFIRKDNLQPLLELLSEGPCHL